MTSARHRVLAAVSSVMAGMSLMPLTTDLRFPALMGLTVALVCLVGLGLAVLRMPGGIINLVQTLASYAALLIAWLRISPETELGWQHEALLQFDISIGVMVKSPAPMPAEDGVLLLLVAGVATMAILADLLFVTCWSPVLAGLPLLGLYLVPALVLPSDAPWWTFLLTAGAWIILLVADTARDDSTWPRSIQSERSATPEAGGAVWLQAAKLTIPALALALLLGSVIPGLGTGRWQGLGAARSGPLQLKDPTIDLRDNLRRPDNVELLRYRTAEPGGVYLRSTSLPVLSATGWHAESVTLRRSQPDGVPGLGSAPAVIRTDVRIGEFASPYLPAPYAPLRYSVPGLWSHDPVSLMIYNIGQGNESATRDLRYWVESTNAGPDAADLADATAGSPIGADSTTQIPPDVPRAVITLTNQIVAGATSDGAKAMAIQGYLRDPGRFRYSTQAPSGMGYDVLTNFLLRSSAGFCVHFASAMAVMARVAGIPSRVAIGFLPGSKEGDDWVVRAHDLHAWPELYFADLGWVRFEPTVGVAQSPEWTVPPEAEPTDPDEPSQAPSAEPSNAEEDPLEPRATERPDPEANNPEANNPDDPATQDPIGLGWIVGALAIALAGIPAGVRMLLRRRRLSDNQTPSAQVMGAWAEVRDSVVDVGGTWPAGTPRHIAADVSPRLGPEHRDQLAELAILTERELYSPALPELDGVPERVGTIRTDLLAGASRGDRILAWVWPRSLWRNLGARLRRTRELTSSD